MRDKDSYFWVCYPKISGSSNCGSVEEDVIITIWIAILLLILIALLGIGYFLSGLIIHIHTHKEEDIYRYETQAGAFVRSDIEQLPKEEVFIRSPYGYLLRGLFFKASQETRKAIVIVHGVSASLVSSLKYMEMFRKRGFHVLMYDHCRHGGSGGFFTTFGLYEKHDLNAWIDWLTERIGKNSSIGIFGESMGAAIALQHAAIDRRTAFYIADCPYSDLLAVLKYRVKEQYHLPSFPILHIAGLFAWLRCGLRFKFVSPIRDITQVKAPVLFIHGKEDRYIPMEMTLELYHAKQDNKHLYLVQGADHAQSLRTNPNAYDHAVGTFLEELGLGTSEFRAADYFDIL